MTDPPPKSGPASPYATLNGGRRDDEPAPTAPAAPRTDGEVTLLAAETDRLAALKGALYASFLAAPMSPLRAPIVDLTMAYTDALRLELKLRAAGKGHTSNVVRTVAKASLRTSGRIGGRSWF